MERSFPIRRTIGKKRARRWDVRTHVPRRRPSRRVGRFATARELKFLDTTKAFTAFTLAGTLFDDSLNHIAQGATESERVGRKVVLRSLQFRGTVQGGQATSTDETDNEYRIIVYCDKQANGAAATVTDILETAALHSFYNLANVGRFRILYDHTKNLPYPDGIQTAAGTFKLIAQDYKWEVNLRMAIPLEFDNTFADGRIGTIRSNNIGIIGLSLTDSAPPLLAYTARIRYSDA